MTASPGSRFPHSLVLIFALVVAAQLLTYVLPQGSFSREPLPAKGDPFVESSDGPPLRDRLKAVRQKHELTEEAVAKLFQVSAPTVRGWELGAPEKGEPWRPGTHIEAKVGTLIDRWVDSDAEIAPTPAEIATWKSGAGQKTRVVPNTFNLAKGPTTGLPWYATLMSIPKGFKNAASVIFFVFVVGGVIAILRATGAIDALIGAAIRSFSTKPVLLIATMTLLFAIGSSTIGMAEEYMPFVPLLVTLCLALKLDAVVALGIVYIGAGVGYGCAALNPFTVLIAQDIAGLEPTSGWEFRVVFMLAMTALGVVHILRYAGRVKRDPSRSLVADIDYSEGYELPSDTKLTPQRMMVLALFVGSIGLLVYGVARWDWYFTELMAVFLGLGIVSAIVARLSPNLVATRFCEGAAEMTTTALLIGVARTIEVVLNDGHVIDTVIKYIADSISGAGPFMASIGMLGVQSATNFFVPSGSGQAYVTMPIMAPLADLCSVSRQTAVLAYQTGDGFMNMVVPTNALLMGMLALARIPFTRWIKFIAPLMLQLFVGTIVAMLVASWIGY